MKRLDGDAEVSTGSTACPCDQGSCFVTVGNVYPNACLSGILSVIIE